MAIFRWLVSVVLVVFGSSTAIYQARFLLRLYRDHGVDEAFRGLNSYFQFISALILIVGLVVTALGLWAMPVRKRNVG